MPARSARRRVRAVLLGGALTVLTLAGHTAAGGTVGPTGIALVVVLAALLGATLSTARMGTLRVLGVLLAGQALLHVVMAVSGHHSTGGFGPSPSAMIAAHTVAALLATAVVVRAEQITAAWQRFLSVILGAVVRRQLVVVGVVREVARLEPLECGVLQTLVDQVVRRGPPAAHRRHLTP